MTDVRTPVVDRAPATVRRPNTLSMWIPVLAWVAGTIGLYALAIVSDLSSREPSLFPWGFAYESLVFTLLVGGPLFALAFLCAILGCEKVDQRVRVRYVSTGAASVACFGAAMAALSSLFVIDPEVETERVFGTGGVAIGLALLLPLVWCLWLRQSLRSRT